MVSPRILAVFTSMTSSNDAGCSTGRSAGFAPLRILSRRRSYRVGHEASGLDEEPLVSESSA